MENFTVCAFFALLVGAFAVTQDLTSKWEQFKAKYGKKYTCSENTERMQRFGERLAEIEAHNVRFAAGQESFSRQLNRYSDLTDEELNDQVFGYRPVDHKTPVALSDFDVHGLGRQRLRGLPSHYDTEEMGFTTSVKDQEYCGSCYAFVAVALLEAHIKRRKHKTLDLSEQQVIDCTYEKYYGKAFNKGCVGGSPHFVLEHIIKHGITTESHYPYTSGTTKTHGTCQKNKPKANLLVQDLQAYYVLVDSEESLRELLFLKGPLVVTMGADNQYKHLFVDLKDGIYDVPNGHNVTPNHGILLVGYGSENGKPYWKFENTWGPEWGNGGYGKLVRGKNMANILEGGVWYVTFR